MRLTSASASRAWSRSEEELLAHLAEDKAHDAAAQKSDCVEPGRLLPVRRQSRITLQHNSPPVEANRQFGPGACQELSFRHPPLSTFPQCPGEGQITCRTVLPLCRSYGANNPSTSMERRGGRAPHGRSAQIIALPSQSKRLGFDRKVALPARPANPFRLSNGGIEILTARPLRTAVNLPK